MVGDNEMNRDGAYGFQWVLSMSLTAGCTSESSRSKYDAPLGRMPGVESVV